MGMLLLNFGRVKVLDPACTSENLARQPKSLAQQELFSSALLRPHVAMQSPSSTQSVMTQSIEHGSALQGSVCMSPGHCFSSCAASALTVHFCFCSHPPQVLLHVPSSCHSLILQSTGHSLTLHSLPSIASPSAGVATCRSCVTSQRSRSSAIFPQVWKYSTQRVQNASSLRPVVTAVPWEEPLP